jgi:chromosome partitioning protein
MPDLLQTCCICNKAFHVQFSYQMEEQTRATAEGQRTSFRFFCSQDCVKNSHQSPSGVPCDACGTDFQVTHAAHVLVITGKRKYACSTGCREQLVAEAKGLRLGDIVSASHTTPAPARPYVQAVSGPSGAARGEAEPPPATAANNAPQAAVNVPNDAPSVIAVFNHKGGTGKTTSAVTLAAGLARAGKRTLLVDTDSQGNVAVSLGLKPSRSLYHVLVMGLRLQDAIVSARENLDVLAANETLAAAELYLAGRQNRDRVLSTRLAEAKANYDYVVVDCSPSLSLLNQNALVFADGVLCPVACDYLSLVGVRQVVKTVKNVNRLLSHPVQIWGVLPTMYDTRARICNEALETLQEHFGERCFSPVRSAIRVKEAPSQGQTLFEYAPDSNAAADYQAVVNRLISQANAPTQTSQPVTHPEHLAATA